MNSRKALGFLAFIAALLICLPPVLAASSAASKTERKTGGKTAAKQKAFMWKVTGSKGTVYLLGSIHLVKPNFYPLPTCVENTFKQSEKLVVEIDESKSDPGTIQSLITSRGMYSGGDNIENHISEETLKSLRKYMGTGNQAQQSFLTMKPWLIGMLIPMKALQEQGFDPNIGIDKHFLSEAAQQKKSVDQLETADFQVSLLSSFDDATQEKLLQAALVDLDHTERDATSMVHAWKSGDAVELEKFIDQESNEHPELKPFIDKLLDERNKTMLEKIDAMLQKPGQAFVVVGAAHLIGPNGLIALLKQKNYSVEQELCN